MSSGLENYPELQELDKLLDEQPEKFKELQKNVKIRNFLLIQYYIHKHVINKKRDELVNEIIPRLTKEGDAYSDEALNRKVNERLIGNDSITYNNLIRKDPHTDFSVVKDNLRKLIFIQNKIEEDINDYLNRLHGNARDLDKLEKPVSEEDFLLKMRVEEEGGDYEEARREVPRKTWAPLSYLSKLTHRKGGKKKNIKKKTLKKRKINNRKINNRKINNRKINNRKINNRK